MLELESAQPSGKLISTEVLPRLMLSIWFLAKRKFPYLHVVSEFARENSLISMSSQNSQISLLLKLVGGRTTEVPCTNLLQIHEKILFRFESVMQKFVTQG